MSINICFVTGNPHKLTEIQELVSGLSVNLRSISLDREHILFWKSQFLVTEIQGSINDIVTAKCKQAFAELKHLLTPNEYVLVDDTSLCFQAMNGHPGPYIKDLIKKMKLEEIYNLLKYTSTDAIALATFALYNGKGDPVIVQGSCQGNIVPPAGNSGFGWDPMFQPIGHNVTFAQMPSEEKNAISHRFNAMVALKVTSQFDRITILLEHFN